MTFEVLECGWHDLMAQLKTAQSLDEVIAAHNHFLKRIVAGALLDAESKVVLSSVNKSCNSYTLHTLFRGSSCPFSLFQQEVRTHLRTFYNLIQNLRALQERLSHTVSAEVNARKNAVLEIKVM